MQNLFLERSIPNLIRDLVAGELTCLDFAEVVYQAIKNEEPKT